MDDDEIVYAYNDEGDEMLYLDDETSEYLMHPIKSHIGILVESRIIQVFYTVGKLINVDMIKRELLDTGLIICGLLLLKLQGNVTSQAAIFLGAILSFYFLRPFIFGYVGYCSQYLYPPETFISNRGCFMVMIMKTSSIFFDMENGVMDNVCFLRFCAYVLDPMTLLFGPWISYAEFSDSLRNFLLREMAADVLFGLLFVVVSFAFVFFSTCGIDVLYPDNWFITAYATAQSFRFSHYFITWLSYGVTELSGCNSGIVSRWWRIEFPRSLVDVVVSWDLPMHRFLRKCVNIKTCNFFIIDLFSEVRHMGVLRAVLITYMCSSLLHVDFIYLVMLTFFLVSQSSCLNFFQGINFQLSAVLLSLGLFTFVETKYSALKLRSKLSRKCDACVLANQCSSDCKHKYKTRSVITVILNMLFRFLAVYHLIYLGMIFDDSSAVTGYSMAHTLSIWSSWKYSSHLITAVLYLPSVFQL
uniref:MBOAT_2 domain-containing protein n=1 Tax=Syphacia muris TaxID=451379 RepID=A0A0N5AMM8_9BILA